MRLKLSRRLHRALKHGIEVRGHIRGTSSLRGASGWALVESHCVGFGGRRGVL